MKHLLFVIGLAISISGFGQQLLWESGVLITKSDEVLTGSIIYHAAYDAVLLKCNDKVDFFPSHKIRSFRLYDSKAEINRQFISVDKSEFFPSNAVLEIVINGSVKIIRRIKGTIDKLGNANDASDFAYYILCENKIIPIQKFKSKILPTLLKTNTVEMKEFLLQSKIDINSDIAAFQVIKEYNKLVAKPQLVAKIN